MIIIVKYYFSQTQDSMWELTDHIIHCYLTNNLRNEIHAKMPLKLNYYCKHCILFNFETNGRNWSKLISTETCWKLDFIQGIWWSTHMAGWEATRFVPYQGDYSKDTSNLGELAYVAGCWIQSFFSVGCYYHQ